MAARTVRDREVPGSNPGPPTIRRTQTSRPHWHADRAGQGRPGGAGQRQQSHGARRGTRVYDGAVQPGLVTRHLGVLAALIATLAQLGCTAPPASQPAPTARVNSPDRPAVGARCTASSRTELAAAVTGLIQAWNEHRADRLAPLFTGKSHLDVQLKPDEAWYATGAQSVTEKSRQIWMRIVHLDFDSVSPIAKSDLEQANPPTPADPIIGTVLQGLRGTMPDGRIVSSPYNKFSYDCARHTFIRVVLIFGLV